MVSLVTLGQQYNVGEKPTVILYIYYSNNWLLFKEKSERISRPSEHPPVREKCLKKNQNAPRPSEHPPVRGGNAKTFRWDHRLQIQNLLMAFVDSHIQRIATEETTVIQQVKPLFKKNLNASKPSEHPPQVEECLKV